MALIKWDTAGERRYEAGVDRGVLYSPFQGAIAWNGLVSIDEKVDGTERSALYFDGVKFGEVMSPGDFAATLRAYTYPDQFLALEGTTHVGNGLFVGNQRPYRFGLSYRTLIADDIDGFGLGYKIHVLYNLLAVPSQRTRQTTQGNDAMEFTWELTAVPGEIPGYRPSAHLIFDTRFMEPLFIEDIERTLYGDQYNNPTLPDIADVVNFSKAWVIIRITDNLDGTWTATGPDEFIQMLDSTTFQIIQANAVYLDDNTYAISNLTH